MKKELLKKIGAGLVLAGVLAMWALLVFLPAVPKADAAIGVELYEATTLTLSTNLVAAAGSNTEAVVINVKKWDGIALQLTSALTTNVGIGTQNIVLTFAKSVDGTYYQPAALTWTVAANGTNSNTVITNLVIGSEGYLKLTGISNVNTADVLNVTALKVATKPQRRGNRSE